jgi:putative membrane protein
MQDRSDTWLRDRLARQRTEMANERTLLSYVRTALGLIAIGVPAVWWFDESVIQALGVVSLIMGTAFLGIGIRRFLTLKAEINRQSD